MSAKEMFEELGYELIHNSEYQFEFYNEELDRYIWFYKNRKTFEAYDEINLTELKAIKQQCKELGWID